MARAGSVTQVSKKAADNIGSNDLDHRRERKEKPPKKRREPRDSQNRCVDAGGSDSAQSCRPQCDERSKADFTEQHTGDCAQESQNQTLDEALPQNLPVTGA
jgi:hypothetical protein